MKSRPREKKNPSNCHQISILYFCKIPRHLFKNESKLFTLLVYTTSSLVLQICLLGAGRNDSWCREESLFVFMLVLAFTKDEIWIYLEGNELEITFHFLALPSDGTHLPKEGERFCASGRECMTITDITWTVLPKSKLGSKSKPKLRLTCDIWKKKCIHTFKNRCFCLAVHLFSANLLLFHIVPQYLVCWKESKTCTCTWRANRHWFFFFLRNLNISKTKETKGYCHNCFFFHVIVFIVLVVHLIWKPRFDFLYLYIDQMDSTDITVVLTIFKATGFG